MGLTQEQLNDKATKYFNAASPTPKPRTSPSRRCSRTPQSGNFALNVTASASVDLRFMSVFGQTSLPISSSSEVKWGIKKLELAMVLDNTGSMAQGGKMTALKTASHNLLTTLKNAAKKLGDVKVSIIPFDVTVKPGTAYKDEFWIDFDQNDISKSSWEGCVQDRDKTGGVSINNNTKDTTPVAGDDHTWFPAVQCGSLVRLMPLTDVFDQRVSQPQRQDRRDDAGRQHQHHDRAGVGLALAHLEPAARRRAPRPRRTSTRSSSC